MPKHIIRQNCISCVFSLLIYYGSIVGLPPILITCDHKKKILRANISSSKVFLYTSFFAMFVLIGSAISCGFNFFNDIKSSKSVVIVLIRVPNFCLYFGAALVILCARLQISKIRRVCEVLQDTLEIFRESKGIALLTIKDIKKLRFRIFLRLFFLPFVIIAFIVGIIILAEELNLNILESVGLVITGYVALQMTFFIYIVINLICLLYKKCQYQLKCYLQMILRLPQNSLNKRMIIVNNKFVELNISDSLISYRRLTSNLFFVLRLFIRFLNPYFLVTVILFIFAQASIYLQYILRVLTKQPIFCSSTIVLDVEVAASLISGFYFLITIRKLETLKYNMISFCNKYRISRLSQDEAIQFECYLHLLKYKDIIINASDMLLCTVSVFASVFAGILSSISVAIQFIILQL